MDMPAQLLSLCDGPSLLLDKPIMLVGRHEECDIQLNSRKISRKHCILALVGDNLVIRDLGSTNGVRVNGTRVDDGVLRTGDELVIGNYRYQVHVDQRREVIQPPVIKAPGANAPGSPKPSPISEDEMLEAADDPVPLPEPPPPSYPMPSDIGLKSDSSV
jgi:predicted component of type VI protein secretion system